MKTLRFRAPGKGVLLLELLKRAWPQSTGRERDAVVRAGRIKVGSRRVKRLDWGVEPGVLVEVDVSEGGAPIDAASIDLLGRGDDWVVVDKPAGFPSHAAREGGRDARDLVRDLLERESIDFDVLLPVHRLDAAVGGVWLIALTKDAAGRLSAAFEARLCLKEYRALVPRPPWQSGRLTAGLDGKQSATRFQVIESTGAISTVAFWPETGRTHQVRRHAMGAGMPIIGDPLYNGHMLYGGLRLRAVRLTIESEGIDVAHPAHWHPVNEPLFWTSVAQGKGKRTKPAALMVSTATVNAITRGHPWILTDSETSDAGRYQPGTLVPFKAKGAQREGWARVEGTGKLAARVWSLGEADAEHSVESRVERALIERQELLAQANDTRGTNCFRLIHGEADLLPGLAVDYLAGALRILVRGRASDGFRHEVVASLQRRLSAYRCAEAPVVEVLYLVDSPKGDLERVRLLKGKEEVLPHFENGRFVVCERGLRFWVKLGLGRPTSAAPGVGLYLDQRSNRARIDTLIRTELAECAGGVWLNLFAHTGAFSVAALAAGAAHVTSVDLSKPYLRTADENLALNGLAPDKHESVKADARQFVEKLAGRRFDGVILDPPTAARCGRRFWSFQKDGVKLIADVLEHLNPGGALLISRNTHGHRGELKKMLNRAADRAGVALADIRPAPPSPDFPAVTGFPEGDAFQAHLVRRH